jgi:hypothetical protein
MTSWGFYLGTVAFFTLLLGVFYAVAWSVVLQVHENYLRYYQKSELQWTGADSRFPRKRIRLGWVLFAAFVSAWILVHFFIMK